MNFIKKIFKNKLVLAVIILAAGFGGYFWYSSSKTVKKTVSYATAAVETGTIIQSVSGTGQVSATNTVDLKTKAAGEIISVAAKTGQDVKDGDVIAKIDDSDARQSVTDAQIALETAQLSLDKLQEPVDELSLMQAENALTQANESYQDAKDSLAKGYDDGFTDVASAFLDLPTVMTGLQDIVQGSNSLVVQSSANYLEYYYNAVKESDGALKYMKDAGSAYATARKDYDKNIEDYKAASRFSDTATIEALIIETYNTTKEISEAVKNVSNMIQFYEDKATENNAEPQSFADTQLASLTTYSSKVNSHLSSLFSDTDSIQNNKNTIISSQRTIQEKTLSLSDLKEGTDDLTIRSQQLAVNQKAAALKTAKDKLEDYAVIVPFDGMISDFAVDVGDTVSSGATVGTLITDSQIAEITLNEVDIAKAEVGQKATLTFDAVDGLSLTGKVSEIDAVGTVSQGVVSYTIKIAFDAQDSRVKPGMSVTASIITDSKQNVLMAANAAVKSDNAGSYVEELADETNASGKLNKVYVETGISNDEYTEIKSGVSEGDMIVTGSTTSTSAKTTSGFNLFGGGAPR